MTTPVYIPVITIVDHCISAQRQSNGSINILVASVKHPNYKALFNMPVMGVLNKLDYTFPASRYDSVISDIRNNLKFIKKKVM